MDVAYIGNRSRNLMILGDYNQARPNNAGEDVPLQNRRPISILAAGLPILAAYT